MIIAPRGWDAPLRIDQGDVGGDMNDCCCSSAIRIVGQNKGPKSHCTAGPRRAGRALCACYQPGREGWPSSTGWQTEVTANIVAGGYRCLPGGY